MPILDIIQIICAFCLFIIIAIEFFELHKKDRQIKSLNQDLIALNSELDTLKFNIATQDVKITEELLKINSELLPTMFKIQRNYTIAKIDKLKVLNFLIVLMRDTKLNLLQKVNTSRKFTYKSSTDIILQYIKNPTFTEKSLTEVINAAYWIITK